MHSNRRSMEEAAPSPGRTSRVGVAAAVVVGALYGSSYVATAFQLRGFSPIAGGFWRSLAAAALLALLATRLLGRPNVDASGFRRLLTLAVLGGPIFILGMNVAVAQLGATVTAFVAGLY